MVSSDASIVLDRADIDDSQQLTIEGTAPAGQAVCLIARRYRRKPEWWVIEVAAIAARGSGEMTFSLTCDTAGQCGRQGIEVVAGSSSVRVECNPS